MTQNDTQPTPEAATIKFIGSVPTGEVLLYEKCAHCHLFVEPNDAYYGQDGIAPLIHLSRGDEADERFEDHEPTASGLFANLDTWKIFGPSAMRERFVTRP